MNLQLGTDISTKKPVELTMLERSQGMYVLGTTGAGKTTLLKNIVIQDMENDPDHGFCVLDPHGDMTEELLGLVPENRIDDVILFDPMDMERPFGLNVLECNTDDPHEVRWVISTVMATMRRLFGYSWGPLLEHVLRHSLLTAMTLKNATYLELLLILNNEEYRKKIIQKITEPLLLDFWKDFPYGYKPRMEMVGSTINKITPFLTDRTMRNIVGQPHNTINFKELMDKGKILFVDLSKGNIGEENSSLLGSVIVNLILIAALQRKDTPVEKRKQFHLIVDEFQNFASDTFDILQSEARKYGVDVVVAHQFRDQLSDESKGSTLNVGNFVVFRVTGRDSYAVASQFDNTPPPPETRVEPVYQEYNYEGLDLFIETELSTAEGKLYQEVELPRRPYSDVEAEMANKLSILPDWEAHCRLSKKPKGKRPELTQHHILTDDLDGIRKDKNSELYVSPEQRRRTIQSIKERSHEMGNPQAEVEADIHRRSLGHIEEGDFGYPPVEQPLTEE